MNEEVLKPGNRDRWIPGCFIAFFVGLAALEVWFVTIANRTFTGVVTDNAYAVGLNYDQVLARQEAERRLGWRTRFRFVQSGEREGRLTLNVSRPDGSSLSDASVRGTAERMTRFPQILAVEFAQQADGDYVADLKVPLAGRWFVKVKVEQADHSIHVIEEVNVLP